MTEAPQWKLVFIVKNRGFLFTCPSGDESLLLRKLMIANNDPTCPVKERNIASLRPAFLRVLRIDGFAVVDLDAKRDRILDKAAAARIIAFSFATSDVNSDVVNKQ